MTEQKNKTKDSNYPDIGKTVMLDIHRHQRSAFLLASFQSNALNNNWTHQEIEMVCNFLVGKPYDEQLEILSHYCVSPQFDEAEITATDVQFMLDHLGLPTHYLASKPIDLWDEYDRSNYYSLERKATRRIRRVYGYYSKDIMECDKYLVTSPPVQFFSSKEEAEGKVSKETLETVNVFALWICE